MRSHWLRINLLAFAIAVLPLVGMNSLKITPWLENKLATIWFTLRGPIEPPKDVAVITIDRESFHKLGVSPYRLLPRKYLAELLPKLKAAGAKGIAIDLIFQGESDDPAADLAFEDALAKTKPVLASDEIRLGAQAGAQSENMRPAERFAAKAGGTGNITMVTDDGAVRRFFQYTPDPNKPELFQVGIGASTQSMAELTPYTMINFYGPARTVKTYSLYDALYGGAHMPPDAFRDKYVFLGWGMNTGLPGRPDDSFVTPFLGPAMFGVEIHATKAGNVLEGSYIRRADPDLEFRLSGILALLLSVAAFSLRPQWAALLLSGAATSWAVVSYQMFLRSVFIPGLSVVTVVLPLIMITSALYYYFAVYRAQQRIRQTFSQYVSPRIVDRILEDPKFDYQAESRVMVTMMFTDIQGFTSWAEEHRGNVLATLNNYFGAIASEVLDSEGTLVKYIGDGMFALWGAPLEVRDASHRAVRTALRIKAKVAELGKAGKIPNFVTRIGIHRDEVSLGNLGEKRRFDYTAVGSGVNLTSRLEELNKELGTTILVSAAVYEEVRGDFRCESKGRRQIRGMKEPIEVFEVLG